MRRILTLLSLAAGGTIAHAADLNWVGAPFGLFGDASNWDPARVPMGDSITIDDDQVTLDGGFSVADAAFSSAGNARLIESGGSASLSVLGSLEIGASGLSLVTTSPLGSSSFEVTGALTSSGAFIVDPGWDVVLSSGGTTSRQIALVSDGSRGSTLALDGTLTMTGATVAGGPASELTLNGTLVCDLSVPMSTGGMLIRGGGTLEVRGSSLTTGPIDASGMTFRGIGDSGAVILGGGTFAGCTFGAGDSIVFNDVVVRGDADYSGGSQLTGNVLLSAGNHRLASSFTGSGTLALANARVVGLSPIQISQRWLAGTGRLDGDFEVVSGGVLQSGPGQSITLEPSTTLGNTFGLIELGGGLISQNGAQISNAGAIILDGGSLTGDSQTSLVNQPTGTISVLRNTSTIGSSTVDQQGLLIVADNARARFTGDLLQYDPQTQTLSGGVWSIGNEGRVTLSLDSTDKLSTFSGAAVTFLGSGTFDELTESYRIVTTELEFLAADLAVEGLEVTEGSSLIIRNSNFSVERFPLTVDASSSMDIDTSDVFFVPGCLSEGGVTIRDSSIDFNEYTQSGGTTLMERVARALQDPNSPISAVARVLVDEFDRDEDENAPPRLLDQKAAATFIVGQGVSCFDRLEAQGPATGGDRRAEIRLLASDGLASEIDLVTTQGAVDVVIGGTADNRPGGTGGGSTPSPAELVGDVELGAGSRLLAELAPGATRLRLTGDLDLAGELTLIRNLCTPPAAGEFILIEVSGTVTGGFQNAAVGDVLARFAGGLDAVYADDLGDGNDLGVRIVPAPAGSRPSGATDLIQKIAAGDPAGDFNLDGQPDCFDLIAWLELLDAGCE